MEQDKLKHLEFIQSVISRMNSNSFQIKNLTITIIAATLALCAATKNYNFILVGITSTILFWLGDAYILNQERKFRGLYNDYAGISENPLNSKPFEMNTKLYKKGKYSYLCALFSKTMLLSYLGMVILLIIIFFILNGVCCC